MGGFGHWRKAVIKVGQEFVEEEELWADLGLTKEELYEEIRYEEIVQPAIVEFHKTIARKKRAPDRVETSWGANWRKTIDPVDMTFQANESEHFLASFARLSEKITGDRVAKMIKNTIDNTINHPQTRSQSNTIYHYIGSAESREAGKRHQRKQEKRKKEYGRIRRRWIEKKKFGSRPGGE